MEAFQVPAEYQETARQALAAYAVIQEEGARTRTIGQAAAKRQLEAIRRTTANLGAQDWLEGDEVDVLEDAVSEYVRLQKELATIRRLSAKARDQLTQDGEALLSLLRGEDALAEA